MAASVLHEVIRVRCPSFECRGRQVGMVIERSRPLLNTIVPFPDESR